MGKILAICMSEKTQHECLNFILPELQHGIEILRGDDSNCAR